MAHLDTITRVLYIAGSGRSGSTILDNVLGQLEGFVSVGEVRFLWERGIIEDRVCACGRAFSSCYFWQDVLAAAFGGATTIDPRRVIQLLADGTRARRIPFMLGGPERRNRFLERLDELPDRLTSLYRSIREQTGARVIVDSSKLPTYGWLLDALPEIDLRIVHLVRDPRATAHSWRRKRALPDKRGAWMQRQSPLKASILWRLWNTAPRIFWGDERSRYRLLRYEDLMREPQVELARLLEFTGEAPTKLPFISRTEVHLEPVHSVAGNPSRFTTGRVELKLDEEWRSAMRRADRRLVTSVTWPLLRRFGYRR
jgi:hypothetical protein